jgi:signal transduction histidine kinase
MRRRVIISLGLLLALFVIGDVTALWSLQRSTGQLSALAESHRIQVLRADLAASGLRLERDLLALRSETDPPLKLPRESMERFSQAIDQCGSCHHQSAVDEQLQLVRRTFDAYVAATERLLDNTANKSVDPRHDEASIIAHRLVGQTTAIADQSFNHLRKRSVNASASIDQAWRILCVTLVLTALFAVVIAIHLHRRLSQPVEALLADIELMRLGETPSTLPPAADAEFRVLGEALRNACENLATAQDRIVQGEKMAAVGKLAAGVAHEVGNPLASISSVAQIMKRRCADADQIEKLDLIQQHVNRVSRIVRELLTFSRPNFDSRQGHVEIGGLLDRAVSLLRFDKRAGHSVIDCQYGSSLDLERGDPDRLLTVFTNIMINAFDALSVHRNGDGRLTISADEDADNIIITFADNGPGMTKEELANAFEPFFTTKDPGSGTGLGLWVCYQVVEKHGGTIRVMSAPGEGVSVVIGLPKRTRCVTASTDRIPSALS